MGAQVPLLLSCNIPGDVVRCGKFQEGDLEAARDLQYKAIKARMVLKRGPYISTYKAVLGMLGRQGGYSKKPVRMPSEEELESIRKSLRALGHLK